MNLKLIPAYLKSSWYGTKFYAKKNAPEICTAGSIVTGVACAVTTGIASAKVKGIIDAHKEEVTAIRDTAKIYPEYKEGKELTRAYLKTIGKLTKLYAIPIVLGATSVSLELTSLGIMKKSNAALAAAAVVAESKLSDYRKHVIDKYGEEADQELAGDIVKKVEKKAVVDPETGETKYEEETVTEWKGYSQWSRCFGPGVSGWEDPRCVGPQGNVTYVLMQENALDKIMRYRHGYICVNDVYKQMGFPLVDEGWDWGVIWNPNGPEKQFNFCLRKNGNAQGIKFLNGESDSVWLDIDNVQYLRNKVLPKNVEVRREIERMTSKNEQDNANSPRPNSGGANA